ncbi:MAG: DUF5335 domain-containing protein [Pyrinomonadaceae bacterium]|nr:DUF5335 domain-containing protein [Pyrinomonadaceae bacterium]
MRKNIEPLSWQATLSDFSKRNKMRPTRLEVLGRPREVESDYWLEAGLLFTGVALETDAKRGASVEIMLQVPAAPTRDHMTHTVTGVKRVALETVNGRDEALEIEDKEEAVTIMRFEPQVPGKT